MITTVQTTNSDSWSVKRLRKSIHRIFRHRRRHRTIEVSANLAAPTVASQDQHSQRSSATIPSRQPLAEQRSNKTTCRLTTETRIISPPSATDVWSSAFREAVQSVETDTDIAVLEGHNIAELFQALQKTSGDASQDDAFLRGVRFLRKIQVPLENFKLALDLASPLTALEPTTMTVFGVIRSFTAIAISLADADVQFAQQIGQMLRHISYIDECDTLGRRTHRPNIHKTLVLAYQKILEFHKVAFEILKMRGFKLVLTMAWEKDRLPEIVQDFLECTGALKDIVQTAVLEISMDIKDILNEWQISDWFGKECVDFQSRYHAEMHEIRDFGYAKESTQNTIQRSLSDLACDFLLKERQYLEWIGPTGAQQLLITGDPGVGKSTLMAFLIDELRLRNQHLLPQPKLCFFYCQKDRKSQLIDVYSVLILQLLDQLKGLRLTLHEWYKEKKEHGFSPSREPWILEEFVRLAISSLDRPLFIVIDGMDECDRSTRQKLLHVFTDLVQSNPQLRTLFSSRPIYEDIDISHGILGIDLVPDTRRDRFIAEHLVKKRLPHLHQEVQEVIIEKLSQNAQGSAIWIRMTVELIEKDGLTMFDPMLQFLRDMTLPPQLSELYETLLLRCATGHSGRLELAIVALKFLSAARRDLSLSELAWAVTLSTASQETSSIIGLSRKVDTQKVLGLIQPFIARTNAKDCEKRKIRLVHQSVREFLDTRVDYLATRLPTDRFAFEDTVASAASMEPEALALDICIRYLLLEEIGQQSLLSNEQRLIDELPSEIDLFEADIAGAQAYTKDCTWEEWEADMVHIAPQERNFGGFFLYASCHWVDHLGAARPENLPRLSSIEDLCQAGSIRLQNWIEQKRRPDCALRARFPFDYTLYDPLSIISLYGSDAMLLKMLQHSSFSRSVFQRRAITRAAEEVIRWSNPLRLRVLVRGLVFRFDNNPLFLPAREISEWMECEEDTPSMSDSVLSAVLELCKSADDILMGESSS